jgi:hypothetical protein
VSESENKSRNSVNMKNNEELFFILLNTGANGEDGLVVLF